MNMCVFFQKGFFRAILVVHAWLSPLLLRTSVFFFRLLVRAMHIDAVEAILYPASNGRECGSTHVRPKAEALQATSD